MTSRCRDTFRYTFRSLVTLAHDSDLDGNGRLRSCPDRDAVRHTNPERAEWVRLREPDRGSVGWRSDIVGLPLMPTGEYSNHELEQRTAR